MKAKVALVVGMVVIAVAAVLSAQSAPLDAEFSRRLAALDAKDSQAMFDLAMEAFEQGKMPEARAIADRMLTVDSADTRALHLVKATAFYAGGGPEIVIDDTKVKEGLRAAKVYDLSDEEVDAVYKRYGAKQMGSFKALQNTVLKKRCATRTCHGSTDTSGTFYIKTTAMGDRKTIAENLTAVSNYINTLNPPASRLLSVALDTDGDHPGGEVFRDERDASYQKLKRFAESMMPSTTDW